VQPGSCDDLARQSAQIPSDIAFGSTTIPAFGVYINADLIRRLAQQAFDDLPKTLATNGFASDDGPIHLTSLSVDFKQPDITHPNIIRTYINGYTDQTWPAIHFTTYLTDELLPGKQCTTHSDTETSIVDEIAATLLAVITAAVPILLSGVLDALFNQPNTPNQGGVGCGVYDALPDEIPLSQTGGILPPIPVLARRVSARLVPPNVGTRPQRKKFVITYKQPRVDDRGLLVAGDLMLQDRTPRVEIVGPSSLAVDVNAPATFGFYGAEAHDFFGDLSFNWSGNANPPNAKATKIFFERGTAKPGSTFERTITVRVTDQEGSTATASLTVSIYVSQSGDNPPTICKIKPWLKICQPDGA